MVTMDGIIKKLGFNPFDDEIKEDEEPNGCIDDSYNPYDVLTDEEMHFLTTEAYKKLANE